MQSKNSAKRNGFIERNSLQFILSLAFTLTAILGTLIMGGALNWQFNQALLSSVSDHQQQIVKQVTIHLEDYLRSFLRVAETVNYSLVKNSDLGKTDLNRELSILYAAHQERLVSIALFDLEGNVVSAAPYSNPKPHVDITQQEWFHNAVHTIENPCFSQPHVQNIFENVDNQYRWVISISQRVSLEYGGALKDGVLLVDTNYKGMDQICRNIPLGDSGYVYIVNADGSLLYHPNRLLLESGLRTENNLAEAALDDGEHTVEYEGRSRLITVNTIGYTGWKIIGVSFVDEVAPFIQTALLIAIAFILTLMVLVFANYLVSNRITRPITALEKAVQSIDFDQPGEQIPTDGAVEVYNLGMAIGALINRMRSLTKDIMAEQVLKRRNELDALQAQINPHFLYNAMDSIIWLIQYGDKQQAVVMVMALSRFFRISLSSGRNIIPVADEMEHVRSYLTIQQIRFKETFSYSIEVEENVLQLRTIKLIVQPIVENAIMHGMHFLEEDDHVSVVAGLGANGDLYITVKDNGRGMPPEVVKGLLKGEAPQEKRTLGKRGSGVGLYNVQQRIKLYFGEEYGITIQAEPDEGTCVTLHLPVQPYMEGDDFS